MDTFFAFLKKGIIATMLSTFAFVAVYVPTSVNQVSEAEAAWATEPTQILNEVQNYLTSITIFEINVWSAIKAAYAAITSFATAYLQIKEGFLDGIAWSIAKGIVSSMVGSLVDWINSGFQGSPAFVQDMIGHVIDAADQAVGGFLSNLGSAFSFVCSPFKLDIQVALALNYQQSRKGSKDPTSCKLSDMVGNVEDFISGAKGSFTEGGWEDWLTISRNADKYTPYGSFLSAEASMAAQITNAKGESHSLLNFGGGFLSGKICETVHGEGTTKDECFISKPGKVIQEALTFNLSTGQRSLIAADEIDEIIGALLNQLLNAAITGAAGLLGLTGGTGHTYSGFDAGSYTAALTEESAGGTEKTLLKKMKRSLEIEKSVKDLAEIYERYYLDLIDILSSGYTGKQLTYYEGVIKEAKVMLDEITRTLQKATLNIEQIKESIDGMENENVSKETKEEIMNNFLELPLHMASAISQFRSQWDSKIKDIGSKSIRGINPYLAFQKDVTITSATQETYLTTVTERKNTLVTLRNRLISAGINTTTQPVLDFIDQTLMPEIDGFIQKINENIVELSRLTLISSGEDVLNYIKLKSTVYNQQSLETRVPLWDGALIEIDKFINDYLAGVTNLVYPGSLGDPRTNLINTINDSIINENKLLEIIEWYINDHAYIIEDGAASYKSNFTGDDAEKFNKVIEDIIVRVQSQIDQINSNISTMEGMVSELQSGSDVVAMTNRYTAMTTLNSDYGSAFLALHQTWERVINEIDTVLEHWVTTDNNIDIRGETVEYQYYESLISRVWGDSGIVGNETDVTAPTSEADWDAPQASVRIDRHGNVIVTEPDPVSVAPITAPTVDREALLSVFEDKLLNERRMNAIYTWYQTDHAYLVESLINYPSPPEWPNVIASDYQVRITKLNNNITRTGNNVEFLETSIDTLSNSNTTNSQVNTIYDTYQNNITLLSDNYLTEGANFVGKYENDICDGNKKLLAKNLDEGFNFELLDHGTVERIGTSSFVCSDPSHPNEFYQGEEVGYVERATLEIVD